MDSFSIREAADRLGVSHKVVRRLVAQGALAARKTAGAHGAEWRVDADALERYMAAGPTSSPAPSPSRTRVASPSPSGPSRSPSTGEVEALRAGVAFLQQHVATLTDLLARAMAAPRTVPTENGARFDVAPATQVETGLVEPAEAAAPACLPGIEEITAALQSSLQSIDRDSVACVELCSTRVLWGRPVLWRVAAHDEEDVAALLDALGVPDARWSPPGEEVVFLWLLDAAGRPLWGAACGPGWFGPAFEDALRACSVERR